MECVWHAAAPLPAQAFPTVSLLHSLSAFSEHRRRLVSGLWEREAKLRGVRFLGPALFLGRPILTVFPGSAFVFKGENRIYSDPRCNDVGNAHACVLRTLSAVASIEIGRGVGMSSAVICAAASITVGDETILGAGSMLLDNDFHERDGEFGWKDADPARARPIRIGRGCFLATRCIILKGVTLGDRVTVGAGAVVTKDVPSGAIVAGNPARIVRRPPPPESSSSSSS